MPLRRLTTLLVVVVALGAGCDDGDESTQDTLAPLDTTTGSVAAATSSPGAESDVQLITEPSPLPIRSLGFVSIQVRLAARGIDETISLDRSIVAVDKLDPISLDATCSALDGEPGFVVAVVDLRRLGTDNHLVSAMLEVPDFLRAGEYEGTLQLGDQEQRSTTYTGMVSVDEDRIGGTFEMTDAEGGPATGSFTCARQAPGG